MNGPEASDVSGPIDAPDDPVAVATRSRRFRPLARRTVVVSIVTLGVAAGGGAIAMAAGGHGGAAGSTAPGYGAAGPEGAGAPGGPGGRPGRGGPMMHSIHGTFVVPSTSNGKTTYVTEVQQAGTVTALSDTSITLKSPDGHTATYVIGSSTKKDSAVALNGQAVVVATGSPATALSAVVPGDRPGGGAGGMRGGAGGAAPSGGPTGQPTGGPKT